MRCICIDYSYYLFPLHTDNIEQFMEYLNNFNAKFIPLDELSTDNCVYPYFIKEDIQRVFLNLAMMNNIFTSKDDITILERDEYEARLSSIVYTKCVSCKNYSEEIEDNLCGHRTWLCLNGECAQYERNESTD